ncbi:CBS domain-containing protein [Alicyclobacillus cycloheptanicus]|uniref:CBS-domain-containing membrane protein n=1 Tax=Alicyclobacillus cycloheptanicus TaxID=1457 RepID=A0ABT9XEP0_9BACL|nr:CBS domain-containing protein [Alicyclobacillus cycloheptanicus]MDQ0188768.1 CBS-domain-containing membrane protein [Alicyclobacillus cycloheptanicus]WDM00574.1 CBS domain-containing protein [Alicyclobacillus cycloheptanicus]
MNASEIMLESPVVVPPDMLIPEAAERASRQTLDIVPVVDSNGIYHGAISKAALVDNLQNKDRSVVDICCADAIVCSPDFALEELAHDAQSPVPHQTIVVVDDNRQFRGVIPHVHWAVDEAKTQSGYPRNRLEARTVSMHFIYKCTDCGEWLYRNSGIPPQCPACGAGPEAMSLYTED